MKTIFLTIFSVAAFLTACRREPSNSGTRIVYDAGDQRVITHSVNKQRETMSILYGNTSAYEAALAGNGSHRAGEAYTLVTWRYHDNPMWYGSKINGELLSVEQLRVTSADGQMDYHVERGTVEPVNGRAMPQEERIRYLLEHRPSIMP